MLKNILSIAFRNLWRQGRYTAFQLLNLSIGLTATLFIWVWIQGESNFDAHHADADRIYRINSMWSMPGEDATYTENTPLILSRLAEAQLPEIEEMTKATGSVWNQLKIRKGNDWITEDNYYYVDEHWFSMFTFEVVDGSTRYFSSDKAQLVISADKAMKYFGTTQAAGRLLQVDTVQYLVQAVLDDQSSNSVFQKDFYLPLGMYLKNEKQLKNDLSWGNYNYSTFVKLTPTAAADQLAAQLRQLTLDNTTRKAQDQNKLFQLQPLKAIHTDLSIDDDLPKIGRRTLEVFALISMLLLIMVCINYVNMATARTSTRLKEVSVRKIIGASRKYIVMHLLGETVLLAVLSLLMVLVLFPFLSQLVEFLLGYTIRLEIFSSATLKILAGLLVLVVLLAGIYPALMMSSFRPVRFLQGLFVFGKQSSKVRSGLVVLQFSIAIVLTIATTTILLQQQYIKKQSLWFDHAPVFKVSIPFGLHLQHEPELFQQVKSELEHHSQVALSSFSSFAPIDIQSTHSGSLHWEGRPETFNPTVRMLRADENYHDVFRLSLREGEWFREGRDGFLLNETASKIFDLQVGDPFEVNGQKNYIIGIVRDFHLDSFRDEIEPLVIQNSATRFDHLFVRAEQGKTEEVLAISEDIWKKFFPEESFDYTFVDETFQQMYEAEAKASVLLKLF
ncbi:MAG: ABC transporter permease, partial [Bacteroidota bacterium]